MQVSSIMQLRRPDPLFSKRSCSTDAPKKNNYPAQVAAPGGRGWDSACLMISIELDVVNN